MCGLGVDVYAFEKIFAGLAGLVILSGLVCFREPPSTPWLNLKEV